MRHTFQGVVLAASVLAFAASAAAQVGRVGGTVKDDTGNPIKGASVTAENPNASPNSMTAATDDKGRFSIIGLKTGPWVFTAQAPGFEAQSGRLEVKTVGAPNPPIEFKLSARFESLRRNQRMAMGVMATGAMETEFEFAIVSAN